MTLKTVGGLNTWINFIEKKMNRHIKWLWIAVCSIYLWLFVKGVI